ncbi:rhodanese-like domain-containing protein [Streptomyces sp. NPDC012637]|uniref:rhodanese-like domain-containing protein n=1 Tax=Streptomyces sp. NPDC012637 TaxID=3364842 RepID=UPI0036E2FFFE
MSDAPIDASPDAPVDAPLGIDELLERVRAGIDRIDAPTAYEAYEAGDALLVDTRYAALRDRDGLVPGALVVERNELEWRLDPLGSHRVPEADSHDLRIVVFCNEGYASSLAVASLRRLGLHRATDLVGGFQAWKAAGLPVLPPTEAGSAGTTGEGTTGKGPSGASGPPGPRWDRP